MTLIPEALLHFYGSEGKAPLLTADSLDADHLTHDSSCTLGCAERVTGCGRAAGKIAEDPAACAEIVREVGAIQQLILMALSENEVVVEQACKTIGAPFTLPHGQSRIIEELLSGHR